MNKKTIVISSAVVFAMFAFVGCGGVDEAEQAAKEAQIKSELAQQQEEIDATKDALKQGKDELEDAANKLAAQSCAQELELAKTQLELLQNHATELEKLGSQVQKSPDYAIQTCRDLNPGLSKPECEVKVEDYMGGKKTEYDEIQQKIVETEAQIAELEAKCTKDAEVMVDANGNIITPGCQSWFDGCNTCKVGELGAPMACTMMACDATSMQPAKCMDEDSLVIAKENCAKAGGTWSVEQNSCFEDPSTMAGEGEK
jgi:hypothetical protein